jgi:hypothetical protein
MKFGKSLVQSTMPFQKRWGFFGMTQLSSLRLVGLPLVEKECLKVQNA